MAEKKRKFLNLMNQKIETKRLVLKPISMKYKNEIFTAFNKKITFYMYPRSAKNLSEIEKFIRDSLDGLKKGTNFQLVILKKDSKEFLGCVGLHTLDKTPEFGVWIKESAQGKRYGQEAVIFLKKWADKHLDYGFILYPVERRNIASRKIPCILGGKLFRKYSEKSLSGKKLNMVEYRIYNQLK